jgi:hypothetical protein
MSSIQILPDCILNTTMISVIQEIELWGTGHADTAPEFVLADITI